MTKIKLLVELEYDTESWHEDDPEGIKWFTEDVLGDSLVLHSNLVGDTVGTIKVLRRIPDEP